MRFEEMNWFAVEDYLLQDDRLMLVFGACEQHAYLSLLTDVKVPLALADEASRRTGVVVAPPLNFGASPYFLAYPGTLSLRVSTLLDAAEDIVRSAYGAGFSRFLVLNGHGGNDPLRGRLSELLNELEGLRVTWYAWWQAQSVQAVSARHGLQPNHANWLEAFPFTRVGDLPESEKDFPQVDQLPDARRARQIYGDGSFGGRYQVDEAIMDELFAAALEDVLRLLEFE